MPGKNQSIFSSTFSDIFGLFGLKGSFVMPLSSVGAASQIAYDKLGSKSMTYILSKGGLVFPWGRG